MLVDFSEERDNSLRQAVQDFTKDNAKAIDALRVSKEEHAKLAEASIDRGRSLAETLSVADEKGNKAITSGCEVGDSL